jgi:hypothetical protein
MVLSRLKRHIIFIFYVSTTRIITNLIGVAFLFLSDNIQFIQTDNIEIRQFYVRIAFGYLTIKIFELLIDYFCIQQNLLGYTPHSFFCVI